MKKYIKLLSLFLIFQLFLTSCTVERTEYIGNFKSKVYSVIPIIGLKQGTYYYFDTPDNVDIFNSYPCDTINQDTIRISTFRLNKLHGKDISFWKNGEIATLDNYKKGKLSGDSYQYYENGLLKCKMKYKNDKIWNILEQYDINGNLLDSGTLKDGGGIAIEYYPDGKIKAKGLIQNGTRNGDWEYYTDTGFRQVVTFKDGYDASTNTYVNMF